MVTLEALVSTSTQQTAHTDIAHAVSALQAQKIRGERVNTIQVKEAPIGTGNKIEVKKGLGASKEMLAASVRTEDKGVASSKEMQKEEKETDDTKHTDKGDTPDDRTQRTRPEITTSTLADARSTLADARSALKKFDDRTQEPKPQQSQTELDKAFQSRGIGKYGDQYVINEALDTLIQTLDANKDNGIDAQKVLLTKLSDLQKQQGQNPDIEQALVTLEALVSTSTQTAHTDIAHAVSALQAQKTRGKKGVNTIQVKEALIMPGNKIEVKKGRGTSTEMLPNSVRTEEKGVYSNKELQKEEKETDDTISETLDNDLQLEDIDEISIRTYNVSEPQGRNNVATAQPTLNQVSKEKEAQNATTIQVKEALIMPGNKIEVPKNAGGEIKRSHVIGNMPRSEYNKMQHTTIPPERYNDEGNLDRQRSTVWKQDHMQHTNPLQDFINSQDKFTEKEKEDTSKTLWAPDSQWLQNRVLAEILAKGAEEARKNSENKRDTNRTSDAKNESILKNAHITKDLSKALGSDTNDTNFSEESYVGGDKKKSTLTR